MPEHPPPPQRRDNGLRADAFVALADVDPRLGEHLLDLLRLADIAAYLEPPGDPRVSSRYRVDGPIERLFVQSDLRRAAREVVLDAAREAGATTEVEPPAGPAGPVRAPAASTSRPDLLAGVDTDAEFARIMAGFDQTAPLRHGAGTSVGTSPAPTEPGGGAGVDGSHVVPADRAPTGPAPAEPAPVNPQPTDGVRDHRQPPDRASDENQLDDDELDDDEHFVPPPAPPFPIPRANTVGAVAVLLLGLLILARGAWFGLGDSAAFPIGIILILVAAGLFVRGLRESDPEDAEPDDGAIV